MRDGSTPAAIRLTIAIADQPHVADLKSGAVPIEGVEAEFVTVKPQIAAFRRMVRDVEFDVCELAPTTYLIARARGAPFIALPIFVMRRFHHGGLLVRPDAGIRTPKDLEGGKIGVRAYSVTTGVWTRGILAEEYAVDNGKITWVVDDEEHVASLVLPDNVVRAPAGKSLVSMMQDGEIAAAFDGNAGLGRSGAPSADWAGMPGDPPSYPELFPNAAELEAAWFRRTGIYPMHGTIVVREALLRRHPELGAALLRAFEQAKRNWLARLRSGEADSASDRKYRALCGVVGDDPLPYGMSANGPSIRALESIALRQGLIAERLPPERAWYDPERV